jgi:hypothetical protein
LEKDGMEWALSAQTYIENNGHNKLWCYKTPMSKINHPKHNTSPLADFAYAAHFWMMTI